LSARLSWRDLREPSGRPGATRRTDQMPAATNGRRRDRPKLLTPFGAAIDNPAGARTSITERE